MVTYWTKLSWTLIGPSYHGHLLDQVIMVTFRELDQVIMSLLENWTKLSLSLIGLSYHGHLLDQVIMVTFRKLD